MKYSNKKNKSIYLENELKNSYLNYAMSVIIGRALPDVRDGLKPVHRRILFAMNVLNNVWNKSYKKSARIVGDVIGKYHPHGDSAVYDTIVRMAQSFSLRYTLIDGQGNFGSIDGDSAAAMRYTEIRMSKIAKELLLDIEKNTVNFVYNYDNTEKMPEIMPSRIPNLLINGSSGIAVGMATNIPPHNISEILNGCLQYIKNKKITTKKLMNYILGPDFPTGGIIFNKSGLKKAYSTGRGKIFIRAYIIIKKNIKNKKEKLIIKEIPYQINKSRIIKKIILLIKEKKIEGIKSIRDESDKDGMRIIIEIKKDSIGKIVLNNLYSMTQLQVSFCINMVALSNGKPKIFSLKKIISCFLKHRKEIIIRRSIFELKKYKKRIHIIKGIIVALKNIDYIIQLIRNKLSVTKIIKKILSLTWKIKKDKYIKKIKINHKFYNFTKIQIKSILKLKLHKLTSLEYKKNILEYQKIKAKINKLNKILNNPKYLIKIIKKELKKIKNKYQDKRKTKIISDPLLIKKENLIQKKDVVVTLSYQGYIKYLLLTDYNAQHRGGKGKIATKIKEKDFIKIILITNTLETILLFSNKGKMYWMKVYKIPKATKYAKGKPIINLIPIKKNEKITAILSIKKYIKNYYIFMVSSNGIVKKTSLIKFNKPRTNGIIAVNLNYQDELIGVNITNGKNQIMLFTSYGKVVRFSEKEVRKMSRKAIGIKGINLVKNDKVVSLIVKKNNKFILTITKNGYGKCTKQKDYPIKSRATQGVIAIKINKRNGKVISAIQVNKKDQIIIITNLGTLVRTRVSEIRIVKRNSKGILIIKTKKNEKVAGIQRLIYKNFLK